MVLEEYTERWQRALARAEAHGIRVGRREEVRDSDNRDNVTRWYEASSYSEPGTTYMAWVRYTGQGITFGCQCPAGSHEATCQHIAAIAHREGIISGTYTQPDLDEDANERAIRLQRQYKLAFLRGDEARADALAMELAGFGVAV